MSVMLVPVVEQFCILSILTQYVSNTLLFPLTLIVKESASMSFSFAIGAEGAETYKRGYIADWSVAVKVLFKKNAYLMYVTDVSDNLCQLYVH